MWNLDLSADCNGTSFHGHILPFDKEHMEYIFGKGKGPSGDNKSTYTYIFTNKNNDVVTVYDFKGEDGHIGAKNFEISKDFFNWFLDELFFYNFQNIKERTY